MSERQLWRQWQRIRCLPYPEIEWLEEVIGRDGQPIHLHQSAGTPEQAVTRWRELLFRCRTDRQWYAARLKILTP